MSSRNEKRVVINEKYSNILQEEIDEAKVEKREVNTVLLPHNILHSGVDCKNRDGLHKEV